MLIGAAPFTQDDPFEILHSHIAREASPPENLRPDVPIALARIIRKCIAKDTVDRYQTAVGLREDLKFCLAHLSSPNEISAFQPGKFDTPDRFHLSQKIYGRAEQLQLLNQCFERAQNACTELVTVLAGSGLGKSALIGEIFKSFAARRGRTASGKYEQFERQVPYRGWLQICGQLIDEVLKENDTGIQRWRERILRVLGGNGHILIKVLPALERILGSQAEVPELPPGESRNRFIRIFSRFIRVFASNERPLVIFLDDVQWADIASVELIQSLLLDPESQNILLIIAYRDSEVTRAHSVHDLLMTLRKQNVNITTVELEPLSPEQISQLIADSFFCAPEEARPLAELVHARTLGNPFFINQFLTGLHRDGHLNFHVRHARWVWNFSEISQLRMTDNVVEYMKQRLSSLSEETRRVMARAAALGTRFERNHLETIL
ncbi:MAG: AAA family ATPase, partial [Leptospiraceae bacterium]|nr:AAA family ATPase [Leptospiraceae bacterium]